jgi:hypothetical protein
MSEADVLQTALAGEHAAVYVYGALGAQTSQSTQPALFAAVRSAYDVHLARRDRIVADLGTLDAEPVPAEPAYQLPADLSTPGAVTARARELEAACAATYGFVVGGTTGLRRRWAVEALTDAAVRGLGFGATPQDLPGA